MIEDRRAGQRPSDGKLEFCHVCALRIEVREAQEVVMTPALRVAHYACPLTVWQVKLGPAAPIGQDDIAVDFATAEMLANERLDRTTLKASSDWREASKRANGCVEFIRNIEWPGLDTKLDGDSGWQLLTQVLVKTGKE